MAKASGISELRGRPGERRPVSARSGSVAAVRSPPSRGDEVLLELKPALVGFRRRRKRLAPFGTFRLRDHDLVSQSIFPSDLALQEVGAALKEVEHPIPSYRPGMARS